MGDRLTKIYTRTGDSGSTGTADGSRIAKDDILIVAQGDLDELNSHIGVLACKLDGAQRELMLDIQHDLFDIGGEISLAQPLLKAGRVQALEAAIDEFNTQLRPLKEFILPGGNECGALCHVARAVSRRAERAMVSLNRERELSEDAMAYINRLSDFLFVFSRVLNDEEEIYWNSGRMQAKQ